MNLVTAQVIRVSRQRDRIKIYTAPDYFVIGLPHVKVNVGDQVVYNPDGVNFGWLHHVEGRKYGKAK